MGSRRPSILGGPQEPDMSGYRVHAPTSAQHAGQYSVLYTLGGGQQSELYDRVDQAALLRQEQMMKSQSLQPTPQAGNRFNMSTVTTNNTNTSTNTNTNTINLRSILEKEKLTGPNFLDWYRNLRIVLKAEQKDYVLEKPKSRQPAFNASETEKAKWKRREDDDVQVACLMLATMSPDLQKQFELMEAFEIITQLKSMFQEHATIERYETNDQIVNSKLEKGKPVGPHVLKMIGLFDNMRRLGFPYCEESATDIILGSLHDGFGSFRLNYIMQDQNKTLMDLYRMLLTAKRDIKVAPKAVSNVLKGNGFKTFAKGKTLPTAASNVHMVKKANGFKKFAKGKTLPTAASNVHMVKKANGFKKFAKGKTLPTAASNVPMVKKGNGFKKVAKGKKSLVNKKGKDKAVAQAQPKPKKGPSPDHDCFYCKGMGHWKRNCPKYLEDLKNGNVVSESGNVKVDVSEEET